MTIIQHGYAAVPRTAGAAAAALPRRASLVDSVRLADPFLLDGAAAPRARGWARVRGAALDALVALVAFAVLVPLVVVCSSMLRQHRRAGSAQA